MWNVDSDFDRQKHTKRNGPDHRAYPNHTLLDLNDHHKIYYSCRKMPFPLVARDWLNRVVINKIDDNKIEVSEQLRVN